jgi:hypothetical protein
LEIIEAVNKTSKIGDMNSKNDLLRNTKILFETILSGTSINICCETASNYTTLWLDFENEILQLCADYLKKSIESIDDNVKQECVAVIKFMGRSYKMDIFKSECIKGVFSLLSKYEEHIVDPLKKCLINEIYVKVINMTKDEILMPFIPNDFDCTSSDTEVDPDIEVKTIVVDNQPSSNGSTTTSSGTSTPKETPKRTITPLIQTQTSVDSLSNKNNNTNSNGNTNKIQSAFDKFRDLIHKLSPTNVPYVMREIAQMKFSNGSEELAKELVSILIDNAIVKQTLIKPIVQVIISLHDTIIPHFSASFTKKSLKMSVSSRIFNCSENDANSLSQLMKELNLVNFYDRLDIISLLENFKDNFTNDRTALPTLLTFIREFEDIVCSKKISRNMKIKLSSIADALNVKMNEEIYIGYSDHIVKGMKILRGERVTNLNANEKEDTNDDDDEDDQDEDLSLYMK